MSSSCECGKDSKLDKVDGLVVCTNCGTVISENYFEDQDIQNENASAGYVFDGDHALQNLPDSIRRFKRKAGLSKVSIEAKKTLQNISVAIPLPKHAIDKALNLFDNTVQNKIFSKVHARTKLALAACCIYSIGRQSNCLLILTNVCKYFQISMGEYNSAYKKFKALIGQDTPLMPCEKVIKVFVSRVANVPSSNVMSMKLLEERSFSVFKLVHKCLNLDGCPMIPFLIIIIYISWQSLQDSNLLKKNNMTLANFCNICGVKFAANYYGKHYKIVNILSDLVHALPWKNNSVTHITKSNVCLYLADIIKYSRTAISENAKKIAREPKREEIMPVNSNEDIRQESVPVHPNMNSEELNELDIPDDELHWYIKSDEEIKFILENFPSAKQLHDC